MHRIIIKNFGPISNVEMDVTDIVILLGEQATGKSTIAKLVYFFKTCSDEFADVIASASDEFTKWITCKNACISLLTRKFINIFGLPKVFGKFEIVYHYESETYIKINSNDEKKINIALSNKIYDVLKKTWNELISIPKSASLSQSKTLEINHSKSDILYKLYSLFSDFPKPIYIPAGRALLSRQSLLQLIQSDELRRVKQSEPFSPFDIVDVTTRYYIAEVSRMRMKAVEIPADDLFLSYLKTTSREMLKGTYAYVNQTDYIQLDNSMLIPLSYSSSGQQEIIWLLNILFHYATTKTESFVIIEEPETHLHPDAQYLLTKYIAAFRNKTSSGIFITTHSPYILSSFNNLFFAGKCGQTTESEEAIDSVIPKHCWLSPKDFSAYIMENGSIRDIKDEELAMVDVAELDVVASKQDTEYEKLLRIVKGEGK